MILDELEKLWELERSSAHRDSYEGRRLQSARSLEAYAGVGKSGQERFVALRLTSQERKAVADRYPRSSRGIAVEAVESGSGGVSFFLREKTGAPERVFPAVMADVFSAGEQAPPGNALRRALDRFASWQSALSRLQGEMSAQEVRGIYGELMVARDLMLPELGAERALEVWRAPEDDHVHDYVGRGWELEVKTLLRPGDSFHVNADGQLEAAPPCRVIVATVELEPADDGASLAELTQEILACGAMEADQREEWRNAMIRRGAMARALDAEATRRYRVACVDFLEVRDGFPRITRGQVPRGVGTVRYEVSLAACSEFRSDPGTLAAEIKTMEQPK